MLICKALESILRPHKTRCTSSSRFLIYFWWRIIQTTFRGPAFSWSRKWQKPLKSVKKWELCKNCKRVWKKTAVLTNSGAVTTLDRLFWFWCSYTSLKAPLKKKQQENKIVIKSSYTFIESSLKDTSNKRVCFHFVL